MAKGREKALTVTGLEKKKAKALSTEQIETLIVGKDARIKNLLTGSEYDANWGADGTRTLAATEAFASSHGQGVAKNRYKIEDGKLSSSFVDGSVFSSRVFQVEGRYLAAKDDEAGFVNYEIFPRWRMDVSTSARATALYRIEAVAGHCLNSYLRLSPSRQAIVSSSTRTASSMAITGRACNSKAADHILHR